MSDLYRVRLEAFEGPLDLLLHLIKKNEVDVTNIPVATITEQYLGYLDMMRELQLDIAGEFLVMASSLMLIKSRMLLPAAEDEEDEEEDPRADLVRQLLEYQRYREAAYSLAERPLLHRDVFVREPSMDVPAEAEEEGLPRVRATVWELLEALRAVLKRARPDSVHEVVLESVSLRDRARLLLDALARAGCVDFETLFEGDGTRMEIIVTFLALLELMKMGAVRAVQSDRYGRIVVEMALEAEKVSLDGIEEYESAETSPGGRDGSGG
jgi:segregation and condensation protein A